MLAQRLRHWPNIKTSLFQRAMLAGSLSISNLIFVNHITFLFLSNVHQLKCVLGDFNMPDVQWSDRLTSNNIGQSIFL